MNGVDWRSDDAKNIRNEIRGLKKLPNSSENKRRVKKLYSELDAMQFKKDYINVIIDRSTDYVRMCKGFKINGVKYRRLLGTTGGIKNSTITFVSDDLYDELIRRIDNDRNMNKEFNPAKLEAYRALTCSASTPVTMPHKILVVNDCETEFYSDVIHLSNGEDEPVMKAECNNLIKMDASDGFGLISPALSRKWANDVGIDYTPSGMNTRFAFSKGMVITFDFLDFAESIAHSYIVKDAWGDDVDIRDVDIILTTSMVKLWDSYDNCESYVASSVKNGYNFGITKVSPKYLENERHLNYQFIQSYRLDDNDIEELIAPSVNEIKDVLGGDWRKTVLFLLGTGLTIDKISKVDNSYAKAIMIDHNIVNDSYVQSSVYRQIHNRINEAKTGVIKVHGNFSIACGDPFALCQSIFGLNVTGLLRAGEIYNRYWADEEANEVVCFRAPMSCHNNIVKMRPIDNPAVAYWYRYIRTCTVFNAWDTSTIAMNGMDYDGDLVMITDNNVLVSKHRKLPALCCEQKTASKMIPAEEDFVKSNIASFGNDIGKITNKITSMYEVQSYYDIGSPEHNELEYRIQCGQLHQQDVIDI